jgi:hypothetical protein
MIWRVEHDPFVRRVALHFMHSANRIAFQEF